MKIYEDNNMFVGIMDTQIILATAMAKKKKQKREAKMYDIAFLLCCISFFVCTFCCIISPVCSIPTWAVLTFMGLDALFVYLAYQLKPKMLKKFLPFKTH